MDLMTSMVLCLISLITWIGQGVNWVLNQTFNLMGWLLKILLLGISTLYPWVAWSHSLVWLTLCVHFVILNFKPLVLGLLYPLILYLLDFTFPDLRVALRERRNIGYDEVICKEDESKKTLTSRRWIYYLICLGPYLVILTHILRGVMSNSWMESILDSYCEGGYVKQVYTDLLDLRPYSGNTVLQLFIRLLTSILGFCTISYIVVVYYLFKLLRLETL